jgi:hypothetical protein
MVHGVQDEAHRLISYWVHSHCYGWSVLDILLRQCNLQLAKCCSNWHSHLYRRPHATPSIYEIQASKSFFSVFVTFHVYIQLAIIRRTSFRGNRCPVVTHVVTPVSSTHSHAICCIKTESTARTIRNRYTRHKEKQTHQQNISIIKYRHITAVNNRKYSLHKENINIILYYILDMQHTYDTCNRRVTTWSF